MLVDEYYFWLTNTEFYEYTDQTDAQSNNQVSFTGVSCATVSDCSAVGSGTHGPVIESKSGSRWRQERQALGPKATLTDVALQPGGGAIAVGYRTTTSVIYPVGERRR